MGLNTLILCVENILHIIWQVQDRAILLCAEEVFHRQNQDHISYLPSRFVDTAAFSAVPEVDTAGATNAYEL